MSGDLKIYRFADVIARIDQLKVEDWFEGDDVITVEPLADGAQPSIGAGGSPLISISSNMAATIKLKLQVHSSAHKLLMARYALYRQGTVLPFRFALLDTINGEGGAAAQCVVQRRPNYVHGEKSSVREWTIFAGQWIDTPTP